MQVNEETYMGSWIFFRVSTVCTEARHQKQQKDNLKITRISAEILAKIRVLVYDDFRAI